MTVDAVRPAPLIDEHHHLWDPARRDYQWLAQPALAAIRRPYEPVCELAATYEDVLAAARATLAVLSPAEAEEVFGGNAVRIYGLDVPKPGRGEE